MKKILFLFFIVSYHSLFAQPGNNESRPKLVIGLVVDQMRWDYLYRFKDNYAKNGFERLLREGFSCENTMVPYVPTYTAPGHTSIYTGSVPSINGIVGNDWYDANTKRNMYCTQDDSVNTVGSTSVLGKMSPRNMLTTTVTDELRLATNFKSKVFGVSLKDRGAILPAGHSANAAYWYDDTNGRWISSTYYQPELPAWLVNYNSKDWVENAMTKDWNLLLPIEKYNQSTSDDKPYEGKLPEEASPVFPHKLSQIKRSRYSAFKYTPFAATYTFNMAKEIITQEKMGVGNSTDMITISISSTDYAGHSFGPNSMEIEDTYLRLDRDIADFLQFLDTKIGKGNYLLFLTADHAAAHVPGFAKEHNIPAGNYSSGTLSKQLKDLLVEKYGSDSMVIKIQNNQVYLNKSFFSKESQLATAVQETILQFLIDQPFISFAFNNKDIASATMPQPIKERLINGYNPKRSGQIGYVLLPGYIGMGSTGTTHGAWNPYDAHIPLVWFGTGIKPGKTTSEAYMTDIAPTLSALLKIQMPNGSVGKVLPLVPDK
ncbi:MAG: alkaline phosphatase PafA [Ginsengibacter sp.]